MDIEGAELFVIKDSSLNKFDLIIMERHPKILKGKDSTIDKIMIGKGFKIIEKIGDVEVWLNTGKSKI